MADLKVTIGADASEYTKTMATLGPTAAKNTNQAVQVLTKGSDKAAFALINLSRVAQDAPFGFIAIQNNISPVIDSFGYLVKETGSVKSAFQALIPALSGPAGLGLAIGVITAGFTAYTMWSQSAASKTKDVKDEVSAYSKALDSAASSQAEELTKLISLYDASQNDALTRKNRLDAVQKLQSEYPAYFGNLTKEAILTGKAADAYDRLSNALISKATISASQSQLEEAIKPLIKLKDFEAQLRTSGNLQKKSGSINLINPRDLTPQQAQDQLKKGVTEFFDNIENNYKENIKRVRDTISVLMRDLGVNSLYDTAIKADKKIKPAKRPEASLYDGNGFKKNTDLTPQSVNSMPNGILNQMQQYLNLRKQQIDADTTYADGLVKINENVAMVGGIFTSAFADALSGTQNFFTSLGNSLLKLITQLAAAAAAAFLLNVLLGGFGGGSNLLKGAGTGLGFKNLFSSFSGLKLAEGGIATKPTFAMFGEAGPEAVMPLDKLQNFVNTNGGGGGNWQPVAQIIKGDMLITWTKQAEKSYNGRS